MERNNPSEKKDFKRIFWSILETILAFFKRWFFMMALCAAAVFCVFVWYEFIWKADWDEAKKQQYISEQAQFSFDKNGYLEMVELMEARRERLENFPRYEGRDIFFPD